MLTTLVGTAIVAAALLTFFSSPAPAATVVDVELQLLVDTSGSVSPQSYQIQRQAYARAFQRIATAADAGVVTLPTFALQVSAFSGLGQQTGLTPWLLVDSTAGLRTAAGLMGQPAAQPFRGLTNHADAIASAVDQFGANGFDGARQVIDLSTDRIPNQPRFFGDDGPGDNPPVSELADDLRRASSDALRFDGIVCIGQSSVCFPAGGGGVEQINALLIDADSATANFFRDNLIGGDGAFVVGTTAGVGGNFLLGTLEDTLSRKIVAELTQTPIDQVASLPMLPVAPVPLPAAGWMLLAGLGALAGLRRG